ncbi:hypothetical protein Prudu_47S000100 [Prunus dulcis]|uniref:Retroviral polymerase SH3-like domain-containing protein n=1 Tax=Prunus dulcis TaxID=3755 RepID=A0A5H2XSV5_PRUDU|nr:hypothetical protein Prudu_47S000100 [Prunus dulcis]
MVIFGNTCYISRDREHLNKFDSKSDKGIFLGYSTSSRDYRVCNYRTGTIIGSTNVSIDDFAPSTKMASYEDGLSSPMSEEEYPGLDLVVDFLITQTESVIIGPLNQGVRTRKQIAKEISHVCYVSKEEPKNVKEALNHGEWFLAIARGVESFVRSDVWYLVPRQTNTNVVGTKWIFKNKTDEQGNVVRNKARLVAQG